MHQSVLDLDQHRRDLAPSFERLELVEKDKCMKIFKLMFTHEDVSWNIWFIMRNMLVNTCMWKLPVLRICVCVCVSVPDVWIIILCGYMQFNLIGAKHAWHALLVATSRAPKEAQTVRSLKDIEWLDGTTWKDRELKKIEKEKHD